MNFRFLVFGILVSLIWNAENVASVLLTASLMTGFMGGYLIGRMSLGTFLGVLSNNGTTLPQLPSVDLSTILPSLIPREENRNVQASGVPVVDNIPSATALPPTIPSIPYGVTAPPNVPYVYSYPVAYPYPMQTFVTTTTPNPDPSLKLTVFPIKPVDVPISLDNKIRDRFIRQLAIMDPLNCLPKIFCEVSADPYGATFSMDHGTITNVGPMEQNPITNQELVAYELHLQKQRTTTTTPKPTTSTTTTAATVQNDEEQVDSASEEDDVSAETEEDDDSFEQYRKEHEHKLEMQALDELIDEIDDPQTYMYILRDKKRRKEARKKYKEEKRNQQALLASDVGSSFREDDFSFSETDPSELSPMYDIPDYQEESVSPYLNRRMSSDPPPRPLMPMEPPRFDAPIFRRSSAEAPLEDMFADDPFFDDFRGGSRRGHRAMKGDVKRNGRRRRMRQSFQKEDLMKKYNVAYMIAEKFRSPDMCNVAFPSCPYRAKTILSVVNRMESGLLPFKLSSDKKNYMGNKNNIDHFKNTLQAIERLNKATLDAQSRGEPFNLEKVTEIVSSPSSKINAITSQNIVQEFQQVVAKIKTSKLKKRKKHKRRKHIKNHAKYDAVHYYKKAQMEAQMPKQRVKTAVFQAKEPVRHQDDEVQVRPNWDEVQSFKQTYKEMFKAAKLTTARPKWNTRRNTSKSSSDTSKVNKPIERNPAPVNEKVSQIVEEDDERDARESEEALNALIIQGKRNRSPLT